MIVLYPQVYISVENENDHLPLTVDAVYHFTVEENLPPHTPVGHVTATDNDWGFTNVSYNLMHHGNHLPFAVDKETGEELFFYKCARPAANM